MNRRELLNSAVAGAAGLAVRHGDGRAIAAGEATATAASSARSLATAFEIYGLLGFATMTGEDR